MTHSAGIIGLGWRGSRVFEVISLSTDPVIKLPQKRGGGGQRGEFGWPVRRRVSMKGKGGCRVRVLKLWMYERKDVQMKALFTLDTKAPERSWVFSMKCFFPAVQPRKTRRSGEMSHLILLYLTSVLLFCVHRQNVIRPMGVRPDGTLAPLEETLCDLPEDDSGSDSD